MNSCFRRGLGAALALLACGGAAPAADLLLRDRPAFGDPLPGGSLRYFPRSDGSERLVRRGPPPPLPVGCTPRQVPVPTDAPDDPSYVGSTYGLSKPSYYGLTPPPGVDDPYGRSLLPYCR
ncbi:hypothetical protein [Methylobacterium trifolii]|uniref:Uncharacterized protein n=1 Tax=Methylobacterium trifolii TaxID=1003092 RepID=A0ABQ4U2W3_9HYPH|nr:hypothetical protein [Methylobacterium trifolii]GJE60170.1 hypothetical protein MPOCJGCO_2280 [Methylobacterium trifolii]